MPKLINKIINNYIIPYVNNPTNIFMFGSFFLIVSFEFCQIFSAGIMSLLYYVLFFVFMVRLSIESLVKKNMLIGIGYYILMLCIDISLAATIISNFDFSYNQSVRIHCYIVTLCSLLLVVLHCVQIIYFEIICRKEKFSIDKEVLVLVVITVIISLFPNLECINSWPRWDTYNYYNAVSALSINNIFEGGREGLVVCGHIASPFALISLFIKSISGLNLLNAMYFLNIILMGSTIILLYFIFKKLLPKRKYTFYLLSALLCGVSPYVLGTMDFINTEKLLLVGILLFICGIQYDNYIVSLWAVFLSCNTREYGTVAIAFMSMVTLLKAIISYIISRKHINIGYYFCVITIGILWLFHYRKINWTSAISKSSQKTWSLLDGAPFNAFGYSWLHIKDTFKGEFLTNFSWIFVIIFSLVFIKCFILAIKKRYAILKKIPAQLWNYWEIIAGCIGIQFALCAFITYHLYRYYTVFIILLYIVGIALLNYLFVNVKNREKICNIILCVIALFFIIQSYYTIDPVMLKIFNTISTGKNNIAVLDIHMQNYNDPGFTEAAHYNRQMMYFDEAINQTISLIHLDDNKIMLVSNEFQPKEGISSVSVIEGHGYQYDEPARWMKFNYEYGFRYLDVSSENSIHFQAISQKTDLYSKYLDQYQCVFYIEMPWENLASDYLKEKYGDKFQLYGTIEHRGWVLNVYQFMK